MPLYVTVTWCSRNYNSDPASHSYTTHISNCGANPGITWPMLTFKGSCGRSSLCTCVDWRVEPSSMVMVIGLSIEVTLLAVVSSNRK